MAASTKWLFNFLPSSDQPELLLLLHLDSAMGVSPRVSTGYGVRKLHPKPLNSSMSSKSALHNFTA